MVRFACVMCAVRCSLLCNFYQQCSIVLFLANASQFSYNLCTNFFMCYLSCSCSRLTEIYLDYFKCISYISCILLLDPWSFRFWSRCLDTSRGLDPQWDSHWEWQEIQGFSFPSSTGNVLHKFLETGRQERTSLSNVVDISVGNLLVNKALKLIPFILF